MAKSNSNTPVKTTKLSREFDPNLVDLVETSPRPSPTLLAALRPHDETYVRQVQGIGIRHGHIHQHQGGHQEDSAPEQ